MTNEEIKRYPLGVYRVFWKTGGSSVAAIGQMYNGDRWLAPTNWTAKEEFTAPINYWNNIENVELIATQGKGHYGIDG